MTRVRAKFRDASLLDPHLEHSLVVKRFPLLAAVMDAQPSPLDASASLPPRELFRTWGPYDVGEWRVHATVVASRRVGGRLQFAKLFSGGVMEHRPMYQREGSSFEFDWLDMPAIGPTPQNTHVAWMYRDDDRMATPLDPQLLLHWVFEPSDAGDSTVHASFMLNSYHEPGEMTAAEAAETLETLVRWSE